MDPPRRARPERPHAVIRRQPPRGDEASMTTNAAPGRGEDHPEDIQNNVGSTLPLVASHPSQPRPIEERACKLGR